MKILTYIQSMIMLVIGLSFTATAMAQNSAKDHPLISRFKGSEVQEFKVAEFDEFPLALGAIISKDNFSKTQRLEGKVTKYKYNLPADRSSLEVFRSYQDALKNSGFQFLFKCDGKDCISDKFQLGYSATASGIWCANCDEPIRYFAAKLSRTSGEVYVALVVVKDRYEGGTWLSVVEVKPMQSGLVSVNAQAMADDITKSGHVALYGIYFDTGKSTIKPESKPAIDEIAKLLAAQPALKLHVVGHTDNVGNPAANMKLSKERADAVVQSLVSDYRISATRLSANGVGPLAPVAPNGAEDGRAKNRRVELVGQ